jgi:transcriptional regulator with XRE-family HTH domain
MDVGRGPELKAFLRRMRGRLAPQDVGLPAPERRRRKPGLRIEEAAALAGVSLTWYSALESGKGTRVSANLLERVGEALRLNSEEREMLTTLTGRGSATFVPNADDPLLQTIVDGFTTGPAYVSDLFWNVRAFNAVADTVYGLSDSPEKNLLVRMLTDPRLREQHEDWERIARRMVAIVHLSFGHTPDNPQAVALVTRLRDASSDFRSWWDDYELRRFEPTDAVLRHPTLGRLSLVFSSFVASAAHSTDESVVIVLQPPRDEETLLRLRTLPLGPASSPGI